MLYSINQFISYNRQYGRNNYNIFIAAAVLLALTADAANINDESTTTSTTTQFPSIKKRTCCSFKRFICNNETSPSWIQCHEETEKPIMLLPDRYPEDNFTLVTTSGDNGGTEIKTLLTDTRNYSDTEFCLGWRVDSKKGNQTYEVAIVCYSNSKDDNKYEYEDDHLSFIFNGICLLCSVFFALITLAIYFLLPWLRDLQGKIIMSLLISYCIAYSTLGYVQITIDVPDNLCILTGFTVYYWCFSIFTWLHISCFNIWRTVVLSRAHYKIFQNQKQLFIIYSLFAWGVPAVFLIAALLIEFAASNEFKSIKPQMGVSRCWFHSRKAVWIFFYGPLMIIILSNILYFVSVVNRLFKIQKVQLRRKALSTGNVEIMKNNELAKKSVKKLKKLNRMMNKNKLYLKLFFAMGITFIFELISDLYLNNLSHGIIPRIIFLIMDTVNALQGLILFIVLVLTRRKVLESLFKKLNIPTTYIPFKNENKDEENDGDEEDEENENDEDFETDDDEEHNLTNNPSNGQTNALRVTDEIQMT